jgi:cellulose synthase (UDP-forming)
MWVFLLLTSIVGVWVSDWTATFSIALAWNIVNTLVLTVFLFIAFQEARRLRREPIEVAQPAPTEATPAAPVSPTPAAHDSRASRRLRESRDRGADVLVRSGSTH